LCFKEHVDVKKNCSSSRSTHRCACVTRMHVRQHIDLYIGLVFSTSKYDMLEQAKLSHRLRIKISYISNGERERICIYIFNAICADDGYWSSYVHT